MPTTMHAGVEGRPGKQKVGAIAMNVCEEWKQKKRKRGEGLSQTGKVDGRTGFGCLTDERKSNWMSLEGGGGGLGGGPRGGRGGGVKERGGANRSKA